MANKIYQNQDALRIRLTTGIDISGATAKVRIKSPTNNISDLDATIETAATGIIYADLPLDATTFSQIGQYITWAKITFADGREAAGEPYVFNVYEEGT